MTDGVAITLSGTTLLGVLGILVKVWLSNKPQKIDQPVVTKRADEVTDKLCNERHEKLDGQIENIYGRLLIVENALAAYKATQESVKDRLEKMDAKLDKLISRKG